MDLGLDGRSGRGRSGRRSPIAFWADHPDWKLNKNLPVRLQCNYHLVCDNVLDVTQLTYVQPTTIDANVAGGIRARDTGDRKRLARRTLDRRQAAFTRLQGRRRLFRGMWTGLLASSTAHPNFCVNYKQQLRPATRMGPRSIIQSAQGRGYRPERATPETETTCHYFFAFARNFGFDIRLSKTSCRAVWRLFSLKISRCSKPSSAHERLSRREPGRQPQRCRGGARAHRILQRGHRGRAGACRPEVSVKFYAGNLTDANPFARTRTH